MGERNERCLLLSLRVEKEKSKKWIQVEQERERR